MRFKAVVSDPGLLERWMSCMEKTAKTGVIRLTPTHVFAIVQTDATDGIVVWSSVSVLTMFDNFKIESMNGNEINLDVSFTHLRSALRSSSRGAGSGSTSAAGIAAADTRTIVKLTKRNGQGYLSFTAESAVSKVTQDVPISVLHPHLAEYYNQPDPPAAEVVIELPAMIYVKTVVDRMRAMSDYLYVWANQAGDLTLRIVTDSVEVTTYYNGLDNPVVAPADGGEAGEGGAYDPEKDAEVKVDLKHFSKTLNVMPLEPDSVVASILVDHSLVVQAQHNSLFVTYYVPAVSTA